MFDLIRKTEKSFDILEVSDLEKASFTKRIYIFLVSLFEGSEDPSILYKVQNFIDPIVLLKRLMFIYNNINKYDRKKILEKV